MALETISAVLVEHFPSAPSALRPNELSNQPDLR
jgi:hypothetical protein